MKFNSVICCDFWKQKIKTFEMLYWSSLFYRSAETSNLLKVFWWPLSNGNFGKIIKTWFFDKNYCILFEVQKLIKIQGLFLNVKIIGMCVRFIDLKKN